LKHGLAFTQPACLVARCRDSTDTLKRTAPSYAALGLGVGLLVGITGVGKGSPMAPLLILLFGIQPATTIRTVVNRLHRTVAWRMTGR